MIQSSDTKERSAMKRLKSCLPALVLICICANAFTDELRFTIIHTNDEHASIIPSLYSDYHSEYENPSAGGYARLAALVRHTREVKAASGEPVLVLSAGDFLGGTPFSWLTLEGEVPEIELMHRIGYDAAVIGNHEFDYGPDILASYFRRAGYPDAHARTALLLSNSVIPEGHPLNDIKLQDIYVKELENGLTVGIFGLIGKDAVQVAPYAEPVAFRSQEETAREMVSLLENAGADVIILLSHSGVDEDRELARLVPGIDVIIGGHCHTLLETPVREGKTIIVQAGSYLSHAGYLELAYHPTAGELRIANDEVSRPFVIPLGSSLAEDPEILFAVGEIIEKLNILAADMTRQQFTDISAVVAHSDFTVTNRPILQESPFGNFVTDAMRFIGEEVTGEPVHLAVQANGMLRGSIVPGSMPWSQGEVSFYDLASLVGLGSGPDGKAGYPLVSIYLTGTEIRRVLEVSLLLSELMGDTYFLQVSGIRTVYDPGRAVLLTVPFAGIPVPTTRAVLNASFYTGSGIQPAGEGSYRSLPRKDDTLYHVISDYYLIAFLPMVGELLPSLTIELKDRYGNPVTSREAPIIYQDGQELKLWEAVVEYAASLPRDSSGMPRIPPYYRETAGRLVEKQTIPLIIWPILALALLITGTVLLVRVVRRKRKRIQGTQQAASIRR